MQKRPWALILLALLQFLTPVVSLLFNSWALKVSPVVVLGWWIERPAFEIFENFLLMPIAGLAILWMTRLSYFVFFGALVWNIVANLRYWDYATQTLPWASVAIFSALNLILVSYFLIPAVRRSYFDPRVRWWESKPRYEVVIPVAVKGVSASLNGSMDGSILNLSEGGMLVELGESLKPGDRVRLRFSVLTHCFEVEASVAHVRKKGPPAENAFLHGMQFVHSAETETRFRKLAEGLGVIGFDSRNLPKGIPDTLAEGLLEFLKTGKGLIPKN